MSSEPNTILLEPRTASMFTMLHIAGAKHLNFSDFTQEKLNKLIPNKKTRILI